MDPGTLIQTIHTSALSPPSPDPAGATYLPALGSLLVCDSEVNEMPLYDGANVWEMSNLGAVLGTMTTLGFTNEPTGISFDPLSFHLFFSDDNGNEIYELAPGTDGVFGTGDDQVTSFNTTPFGSTDPEGVAFNTLSRDLFVVDGVGAAVYRIQSGTNGVFDGVAPGGDDLVSSFDVSGAGVLDPEGIVHDEVTDTLLVADRGTKKIYEFAIGGGLLRTIDPGFGAGVRISGIAIAPASDNPTRRDLYVTDRAVDNNADPNENDGKLYEIAVVPLGGNAAPSASAGDFQSLKGPEVSTNLAGSVSDDGHPLPPQSLSVAWAQLSGPALATIDDPTDPGTEVTLPELGSYLFELQASDGSLMATDQVTIEVKNNAWSCGLGPELVVLLAGLAGLHRRAGGRRLQTA